MRHVSSQSKCTKHVFKINTMKHKTRFKTKTCFEIRTHFILKCVLVSLIAILKHGSCFVVLILERVSCFCVLLHVYLDMRCVFFVILKRVSCCLVVSFQSAFYLKTGLLIVFIGPRPPTTEGGEADAANQHEDASRRLPA